MGKRFDRKSTAFIVVMIGLLAIISMFSFHVMVNDSYREITLNATPQSRDTSDTHHTHSMDNETLLHKYPFLVETIKNQLTGNTTTCNPLKYKYFRRLLDSFHHYFNVLNRRRRKATTRDIDHDMDLWCNSGSSQLASRRQRIQIIDHVLYVSNNKYYKYGPDPEGYRTSLLLYLKSLMRKYSQSIDDTDLIWHSHDVKVKRTLQHNYRWRDGTVPYFFTDADMSWRGNKYPENVLLGVSRNYMKYRCFGDTVYDQWKAQKNNGSADMYKRRNNILSNGQNLARIRDYMDYRETIENETLLELLNWDKKRINKALFAGGDAGTVRPKFFKLMNNSMVRSLTSKYFDVRLGHVGFSIEEQLKYKYVIAMDGNSVRDGLFYQLEFGAVILKHLSPMYEFWLFDLENFKHVIFFENVLDLISIVTNMVDRVNQWYTYTGPLREIHLYGQDEFRYFVNKDNIHASQYNADKLREIAANAKAFAKEYLNEESVDCYMINMLRMYNHYLFDPGSIQKSSSKCRMTELNLHDD
eukprot:622026_1